MSQGSVPLDLNSPQDRVRLAQGLRTALPRANPQVAAMLRRDIHRLENLSERILLVGGGIDSDALSTGGDDGGGDEGTELPPNFVTYMSLGMNPDGRGSKLYGVTSIQTDGEYAKVQHSMQYSVGGASYSLNEGSGWTTFFSSEVMIDCPARITINGTINSRLQWYKNRPESRGHGFLPNSDCGPRQTYEDEVVEPAGGSGSADNYPDAEYCVIRYTYYLDTGEVISAEVLYCY